MTDIVIWLLRWTLSGSVVALAVVVAAMLIEGRGRFAGLSIFRVALLACLAAPLLALATPLFRIIETPAPLAADAPPVSAAPAAVQATSTAASLTATPARAPRAESVAAPRKGALPEIGFGLIPILLVGVWLIGMAALATARLRSQLWLDRVFREGAEFELSNGAPPCRLSPEVSGPVVFDMHSPRILAPADFAEWPEAERAMAVAHETQHVRRLDLVWAFVADVVTALYWWMPTVRMLAARHALATEEACDASALKAGGDRHEYARALVRLARRLNQTRGRGLAMARVSSIASRVERLIGAKRASRAGDICALALAMVFGAALLMTGPAPSVAFAQVGAAAPASAIGCACDDSPPFVKPWPVSQLSRAALNDQNLLIELARSGERADRTAAVRALGDWPTVLARAALRAALRDPDFAVRAEAVTALAKRGDRDVELITAALDDQSCYVAAAAAEALAILHPAAAEARLISHTSGGACLVRRSASTGLSGYQTPASAAALRRALDDPDQRVRTEAARSLARVGDGSAVVRLRAQLLSDSDKHARVAAADGLGQLAARGDAETIAALETAAGDPNEHVRYAAVSALERVGDARVEATLIARLQDDRPAVRGAASSALGRLGTERSIAVLRRLAADDPDAYVRSSAADAVSSLATRP